ncbi:MarR family transcriptional regulator, partial [Lactobacillus salivarius]|nr:MarR family transcriptional regulator [Ligilactobacillus salivarius]
LTSLGLVTKKIDDEDKRVTHLSVTEDYTNALAQQSEFWDNLQERLEDEVSPRDLAIFKRVLRQTTEFIAENNPR